VGDVCLPTEILRTNDEEDMTFYSFLYEYHRFEKLTTSLVTVERISRVIP
jgi:hypothetical protein